MPEYKTRAITLKTYDFKDYDKIVVLYSQDKGLIRSIAKGVKRPKSKIGPRVEPLNTVDLLMNEGKNLDLIKQCDFVDTFRLLKKDLKKMTMGFYFCELVLSFAVENDPHAPVIYDALFSALKNLENIQDETILNKALVDFEYKICSLSGYEPHFERCTRCHKRLLPQDTIFLNTDDDLERLTCQDCSISAYNTTPLAPAVYQLLNHLNHTPVNTLNIDNETLLRAHAILFKHITKNSACKLKTPKLLETLCLG